MKYHTSIFLSYIATFKKIVGYFLYNIKNKTQRIPPFPIEEQILHINNREEERQLIIPKIIWIYWEDEKLPTIVRKSVERIRSLHPSYEVKFLNSKSLLNFLPNFYVTGEMPIANKTDLIRLELLYKYGGIWMDATVLISDNLDWVYKIQSYYNPDLIAFYREISTTDFNFPVIESWFLAASKNNEFIKEWLDQLTPLKSMGSSNYYEMMKKRKDFDELKQRIFPIEYLLVYVACQIAMRIHGNFNLYLKRCEDSAFFIHDFYQWDMRKINYAMSRLPAPQGKIPIIKLTNGNRNYLQTLYNAGLVKDKSLLGRLFRD